MHDNEWHWYDDDGDNGNDSNIWYTTYDVWYMMLSHVVDGQSPLLGSPVNLADPIHHWMIISLSKPN